jgi:hypothetical protein
MSVEPVVELVGKLAIAACGVFVGALLLRQARLARSRVMMHWSVMFLSAAGYLFGAMIVLGWGDPALLTRLHYLAALVAVLPGALSATILMLPLASGWGDPVSLYVPLVMLIGLSVPLLTGPMLPRLPRQEYAFSATVSALCVNTMMVAGLFSFAILLFLAYRLRNAMYLALAVAFLAISVGGRVVGDGVLDLALGQAVVVAGFLMFYGVFGRLMRAG